ncbi:hypothetical protein HU200_064323 [Digitaria exilis]|uniref:Zinc knuckle CX2CX4HX4C domain-containing protein n=1 Tax=Digitaria exilis TaxID=1010633 RepID=A0A835A4G3_9POAL|nr:hypothetical protein HU200_064323 [Digitaria exilis]
MQEEVLTGEAIGGDGQKDVHVNLERGLVVHGAIGDGSSGEEEDEFDFGDGDGEGELNFRGDALIVVRYDGLSRLSDVVIDSIPLWIRFYDIPVAMMRADFVTALGEKAGHVLEIGEAVRDFMRVRIDLDLVDALQTSVKIKVKGRGPMEFLVKYEDVPYFCFWCGRIGHSDREYPEEDLDAEEMRYGVELRTSPFKGVMGRQLVTFQAALAVRRGLNYSGAQKEKVASFTGSSNQRARVERRSGFSGGGHDGGGDPSAQSSLPRETKEVLSRQVEDMVVDESLPDLSKAADDVSKRNNDRVPGLNSYMGSSEGYRSTGASPKVSLHARQQWAKKAGCDGSQRKDHVKSPRVVVEIQKQKKSKTSHNPNVLVETLNSLGVEVQHGDLGMGDVAAGLSSRGKMGPVEEEGTLDATMLDALPTATTDLVGAPVEPHQEQ